MGIRFFVRWADSRRRIEMGEALSFDAPSPFRGIMSAHAGGMCMNQCKHW